MILKNKERLKNFALDQLVRSKDCEFLSLPPYPNHPELNPIKEKNYNTSCDMDFEIIINVESDPEDAISVNNINI